MSFSFLIEKELKEQKKQLFNSRRILERAPEGSLKMRERKGGAAFYRKYRSGDRFVEQNITENPRMVRSLLDKKMQFEIERRAEKNIVLLQDLQKNYQSIERKDVSRGLSPAYQRAFRKFTEKKLNDWANADYPKCEYEPQHLVHETLNGIFVRSKSEVIIANTMTYYQIPFHYEERLEFAGQPGKYFYPDFHIKLPSGNLKSGNTWGF